jgi:hypothetical protein
MPRADSLLRRDRDVVLAAVTQNGLALFYADEALNRDKTIVMAAVGKCNLAVNFA